MFLDLDHIFVFVESEAPEAQALREFGLTEHIRRVHEGQGTSNVIFSFDNAFLELIWVHDVTEIRSPTIAPTHLWERSQWKSNGASPFGIAVRLAEGEEHPPFSCWGYQPPYIPEGHSIPIAANSEDFTEPLIFCSPRKRVTPQDIEDHPKHQFQGRRISGLKLQQPRRKSKSEALWQLTEDKLLRIETGDTFHLTLEFDDATQGEIHDFSTELPLSFAW